MNKKTHTPVNPTVAAEGVPGFHHGKGPDGHTMAGMELDEDLNGRVDTTTGDQPGNLEETTEYIAEQPKPLPKK